MYCLVCFISLVIFSYPAGVIFFQIIFYIIKNSSTCIYFINYHYYKILQLNTSQSTWIWTQFLDHVLWKPDMNNDLLFSLYICFQNVFAIKIYPINISYWFLRHSRERALQSNFLESQRKTESLGIARTFIWFFSKCLNRLQSIDKLTGINVSL